MNTIFPLEYTPAVIVFEVANEVNNIPDFAVLVLVLDKSQVFAESHLKPLMKVVVVGKAQSPLYLSVAVVTASESFWVVLVWIQ